MNQDLRRMAEEVLSEEEVCALAAAAWGASTSPQFFDDAFKEQRQEFMNFAKEAIAAALAKLTQGQAPVAWRPKYKFPNWPDYVNWNTGVPNQADIDYWAAQKIELQYAYIYPINSHREDRVRELEKVLDVAHVALKTCEITKDSEVMKYGMVEVDQALDAIDAARNKEQGK